MTLEELITSQPDPRELKRALAVKMRIQGMKHREIQDILGVHSSYISRWSKSYREQGVEGIRIKHRGSCGYLNQKERIAVKNWIKQKKQRTLWDVIEHIEQNYKVVYRSMQSYYELLKSAGMSWHKGRKKVPDTMNLWCSNITK